MTTLEPEPTQHNGLDRLQTRKQKSKTFFLHLPRKMEPIEGSETSAFKPQTPGKYPKENILHKNITVYVMGYTETDTTGLLSPPTVWRQQCESVSSRQSGQITAYRIGVVSM